MKRPLLKICLILCIGLHASFANAQYYAIDSLKKVLQSQREDTNKVQTLNSLSVTYWQDDSYEDAMRYAKAALALAKKIQFRKGEANALVSIGMASGLKREPAELDYYLKAIEIYRSLGDKVGLNDCYNSIMAMYIWQGNYAQALKYAYHKLKLSDDSKSKKQISESLGWIGHIYSLQGNSDEALANYMASLQLLEEIDDNEGIASTNLAIGAIYYEQQDLKNAFDKYKAALRFFESPQNKNSYWGTPATLMHIASIYEREGDILLTDGNKSAAIGKFKNALTNYHSAGQFYETWKDKGTVAGWNLRIGNIFTKLGDRSSAKRHLNRALTLFEIVRSNRGLDETYASLASLDSLEGKYKQAYRNYRLHISFHDSLINEESTKKSLMYKMQYEAEKRDAIAQAEQSKKEAIQQKRKNTQNLVIASLGLLVLAGFIIAFIQWRHNKQKQKANRLLKEQNETIEFTLSELKRSHSQLIQSEKMASLGELTAGIAHEIQNPLNFVNNFSEVSNELIDEMADEVSKGNYNAAKAIATEVKQNLEKVLHHGKRADGIVKSMLQHSRTSNGVKEPTDINGLADEYLRLAYHGLRAKDKSFNVILKTDFDQSIGKIEVIPQDIGRVILNLITNAFYEVTKKSHQQVNHYKPTVSVTTKRAGKKVLISIADNGNGIPQKYLDKIFQPFFTTKPTGHGTGLGLSLSYDIVKAHGGEIKVQTTEGNGAEFCIELPNA